MNTTHRPQHASPDRTRTVAAWGGRTTLATIVVGIAASLGLLGWVARWALTTRLTAPPFPLPGMIAMLIVLLWSGGWLAVSTRPGLACGLFLAAGMTVRAAPTGLPVEPLLGSVSAGLAVWSLLGWLGGDLRPLARRLQRRAVSWQIVSPRRKCLICQLDEAAADGFCADCGRWVRAHPGEWSDARIGASRLRTTGRSDRSPARRQPEGARPPGVTPPSRPSPGERGRDTAESGGSPTP